MPLLQLLLRGLASVFGRFIKQKVIDKTTFFIDGLRCSTDKCVSKSVEPIRLWA